ncbi:hypothetical protein [Micromonospora sp. NPDC005367]|uniref:sodium:solute symporter family transporter n=1 Tax=Micromonospora sp. NPDC005367 TaxID=3155590 RepID=UPI0033B82847
MCGGSSGAIVLAYITIGGLSGAIYNEVLQFFVILAGLIPVTVIGLVKVGGVSGLMDAVRDSKLGEAGLHAWQDTGTTANPLGAHWLGIVFGLGFVLSFGYWTTNFAEVQRALPAKNMSAARRTPIIAAYPKLLIPVATVVPGLIALVPVKGLGAPSGDLQYNNAITLLMRDLLPNGVLGVAVTGLLASFMAGMAANVSGFNTVFITDDIWQAYVRRDRPDDYYPRIGRYATIAAVVIGIGTVFIAAGFSNIMNYIQALFSLFNAPLFATFIIGMCWKRMSALAGFWSLLLGTLAALATYLLHKRGLVQLRPGGELLGCRHRVRHGGRGRGDPHPADRTETRRGSARAGLRHGRHRPEGRCAGRGRRLVPLPRAARRDRPRARRRPLHPGLLGNVFARWTTTASRPAIRWSTGPKRRSAARPPRACSTSAG